MVEVAGLRRRSGEAQSGRPPKLRLLLLMVEVARLVLLEAVLFQRWRLVVVDRVLLVMVVVLEGILLLHEVLLVLLVDLLVVVEGVVRVVRV